MNKDLISQNLQHYNNAALTAIIGENPQFINLLLQSFMNGFYKYLKEIRKAVREKDYEKFKLNVHSITGSARSTSLEIMAFLSYELENTPISETDKIFELIEEMENEAEIIKDLFHIE